MTGLWIGKPWSVPYYCGKLGTGKLGTDHVFLGENWGQTKAERENWGQTTVFSRDNWGQTRMALT